jgi:hypothetical protein
LNLVPAVREASQMALDLIGLVGSRVGDQRIRDVTWITGSVLPANEAAVALANRASAWLDGPLQVMTA